MRNRGAYDGLRSGHDAANRLTQIGGITQTSDADGNRTALTYPNAVSFTYDDLYRLTQQVSGGLTVNRAYDRLGRRVMSSSTADGTRYYVFDGDLLIGQVTVSGGEATPDVACTWGAISS